MTSALFDLGASEAAAHRPEATGHLLAACVVPLRAKSEPA